MHHSQIFRFLALLVLLTVPVPAALAKEGNANLPKVAIQFAAFDSLQMTE